VFPPHPQSKQLGEGAAPAPRDPAAAAAAAGRLDPFASLRGKSGGG